LSVSDTTGSDPEKTFASRRDARIPVDVGFVFNWDIVHKKSSYVCRIRDNSKYEIAEERPLTDADRAMQVLSDQIIQIGQDRSAKDRPQHPVRLVIIKMKPHTSKGKYHGGSTGADCDGFLRIATNLLDVPAEIIALLYAYRWTIEIFFRQFKNLLGCRHLLSHNQNGITIQTYCAIIACLLISLWTGRKPTKRTQEMLCYLMMGWATPDDVEAHVAKLKFHDEQQDEKIH
jgi:IS4 transposase